MKETLLSTRKIRIFQVVTFLPWLGLFIYSGFRISEAGNIFDILFWFTPLWIFYFLYFRRVFQLKFISYDDQHIFVKGKQQEELIPLVHVQSVDLIGLLGVHRLTLYSKYRKADTIHFKSSLWYPLNFRKVDKGIEALKRSIEVAKSQPDAEQTLPSNYA